MRVTYFLDQESKTKECSKCREVKPFDDFYLNPRGRGGRDAGCKKCHLDNRRRQREEQGSRAWLFCDKEKKIKECARCKKVFPFESFSTRSSGSGGVDSICKKCKTMDARDARYGLAPGEVEKMLSAQSGQCWICESPMRTIHVDHCHTTGKVRALLCNGCNTGLGMFKENQRSLARAIEYLKKHST